MKQRRQIGDPRRNYAKEWRDWRRKHKMTQEEMALAAGMTERTISKVENGIVRPHLRSRLKFQALKKRYEEAQA